MSQALTLPLALGNPSEVSPLSVQGLKAVSKVVFDIEGRPAYLALHPSGYTPRAPVEIFLGDYYDLSNGVWRISQ